MARVIGGVQGLTWVTASTTRNPQDHVTTITVTEEESTGTTTPTLTSESGLVTAAAGTASSSMTLVYVYTESYARTLPTSPSSSSRHHVSGLPPGAIAGIVIGSVMFLIILILIVFCSSRRFARRKRLEASLSTDTTGLARSRVMFSSGRTTIASTGPPPQELATQFNKHEIDGKDRPIEVVGSPLYPAELQAGNVFVDGKSSTGSSHGLCETSQQSIDSRFPT
ncbi:hypothetical protein VPNG_06695 [Cytospora leucostoma]|uniref:Uncharacterized protein n=1 Tax=Cytospora leucostoma TaxID=1230097 RepID=A0A423WU10_9PEZI|nr:hypothetical protein VPNG_06695 [Cytospora leucostoma]